MSLNVNQRRTVAVTLRHLEETLVNIERVIHRSEQGILYRRVASFTPHQREQIDALIRAMRVEIRQAAIQFDLPIEEQNATRYVMGTLVLMWEMLEDARPRKLASYGAVDSALEETLDPILQRLIELSFQITDIARGENLE